MKSIVRVLLCSTAMTRAEPTKEEQYGKVIQRKALQPPLGLYRLARWIENRERRPGTTAIIVDVFDPALAAMTGKLRAFVDGDLPASYDLVGFSPVRVMLGEDLHFMNEMHEAASRRAGTPGPLFIAGGQEASMNSAALMSLFPWLDACVRGPGEAVMSRVVEAACAADAENRRDAMLASLACLDGVVSRSSARKLSADVEDGGEGAFSRCRSKQEFREIATFAGENIPYAAYWRLAESVTPPHLPFTHTVRLYSSSFCPHRCTFCTAQLYGWRAFSSPFALSPKRIVALIESAQRLHGGARGVYFNDDDFLLSPSRGRALFAAIAEAKEAGRIRKDTEIFGQTRVTCVNPEVLALAKKAGMRVFGFGVESLSDESLASPELRKGFTSAQALETVMEALRVGIPTTNLNLILFHPTVRIESFIETVEKSVELLRFSLRQGSRLSFNCFPFLELYAGSPLLPLALERGWPIVYEKQVAPVSEQEVEYPASLLPCDSFIRERTSKLLTPKFEEKLALLSASPRWPSSGIVDRCIGVNGLALFAAAFEILDVRHPDISCKSLLELALDLVERFGCQPVSKEALFSGTPCALELASALLASQSANICFGFHGSGWRFRRGNLVLPVGQDLCHFLGRISKPPEDVLLILRRPRPQDVRSALESCLAGSPFAEAWRKAGITAMDRGQFCRILLVAPLGTAGGVFLPQAQPHWGLEQLKHRLLRFTESDCLVYNPNLCPLEARAKLEALLAEDSSFDGVGFSFLPQTLSNDACLIDCAAARTSSRKCLVFAGGFGMAQYPQEDLFRALPFEALVIGPGELPISGIAELLARLKAHGPEQKVRWLEAVREGLMGIPNLFARTTGGYTRTKTEPFVFCKVDHSEVASDIARGKDQLDVVHVDGYEATSECPLSRPLDAVAPYPPVAGKSKFYVKISDRCHGSCVFCAVPRERLEPAPLEDVIGAIAKAVASGDLGIGRRFDVVHFSDHSLLEIPGLVEQLCDGIMAAGLAWVPKTCKSRVDQVTPVTLKKLRSAGFVQVTFGVESFSDSVLEAMRKGTTEAGNSQAIESCLAAGMVPGMDMMFFTPWETHETAARSAWKAIDFAARGAAVSITPRMFSHFGDRYSRGNPKAVTSKAVRFQVTGEELLLPGEAVISDKMELLRASVLEKQSFLEVKFAETHRGRSPSQAVKGLLFIQALGEILEADGQSQMLLKSKLRLVPRIIEAIARAESIGDRGVPPEGFPVKNDE